MSLDACQCGGELRFDPSVIGNTCGGLTLRGWDVCVACGEMWLNSDRAEPAEDWTLAKGGRSVNVGPFRLRCEASTGLDVERLMARVVRLPELERALARIAAGEGDAAAIARESLEGNDA